MEEERIYKPEIPKVISLIFLVFFGKKFVKRLYIQEHKFNFNKVKFVSLSN